MLGVLTKINVERVRTGMTTGLMTSRVRINYIIYVVCAYIYGLSPIIFKRDAHVIYNMLL